MGVIPLMVMAINSTLLVLRCHSRPFVARERTSRMNCLFHVCALISLFCRFANARSDGAPVEACISMAPDVGAHQAEPQKTDPPYMIQVDKRYYNESSKINVTVKANGNATIKGILIQAREKGGNKALGKFTIWPDMTKNLDCRSSGAEDEYGAITHSAPLGAAKMLTFQWEPTSMTTGDIYFRATIVEKRRTYWVGVNSTTKVQDMTARKTTPKDNGATSNAATTVMVSTTPSKNSSTPTAAMETTKDSGAISNVTYSIALIILAISAKLFI